jgi:basic amino acid/polyamine antiporter, APA family
VAGDNVKKMSSFGAVCVVVGSIVGSGIFVAPALVAQFSSSILVTATLWTLGALMCLSGAVIYARLAEQFPQSGGQYIFIRESFSPSLAAIYGWLSFLAISPLMIAGSALFFGEQLKVFWPDVSLVTVKVTGLLLCLMFTYLNHRGIELAGRLQGILVVLLIVTLVVLTLSPYFTSSQHIASQPLTTSTGNFAGLSLNKGLLALAMVLWSFEGFNSATFLTGEIKDGARQIQKIMLTSVALVALVYFGFVTSAHRYIPIDQLAGSTNVGTSIALMSFGSDAQVFVFVLTCLGIATTLHTSIMIGPRITKSMASDGLCWDKLATNHPRHLSPSAALWCQLALVTAFLVLGNFQTLITLFVIVNWFFYGLTAVGFFKLFQSRGMQHKGWDRLCLCLFLSGVTALIAFQLVSEPALTAGALAFVAILHLAMTRGSLPRIFASRKRRGLII